MRLATLDEVRALRLRPIAMRGLFDEWHPPPPSASQSLIEPLSQRELDILRLFRTELSGPEIARELVVALSTVRTHTKGIYSKLNVNSRGHYAALTVPEVWRNDLREFFRELKGGGA